ncbi:Uncharacterised protein at_DN2004 [Pycnogonum litorale]
MKSANFVNLPYFSRHRSDDGITSAIVVDVTDAFQHTSARSRHYIANIVDILLSNRHRCEVGTTSQILSIFCFLTDIGPMKASNRHILSICRISADIVSMTASHRQLLSM